MPPVYKRFYIAEVFAGIALLTHLYLAGDNLSYQIDSSFVHNDIVAIILYYFPLAISVTVGLMTTWKYWGWLIIEHKR